MAATTPKRTGRPSSYTPELAAKVCDFIGDGDSLRQACRRRGMPTVRAIMRWLADPERENFRQQYARARELQAEHYAEQIVSIADDTPPFAGDVAKARLQVDARKWVAAKLLPKKYGDKLEVGGPGGGALRVIVEEVAGGVDGDG